MLNFIPEEAERGEFWMCKLDESESQPVQVTTNAGRVDEARLNGDGTVLLFAVRLLHPGCWRGGAPACVVALAAFIADLVLLAANPRRATNWNAPSRRTHGCGGCLCPLLSTAASPARGRRHR